jgi:sugar lactone lactonase YvrE
VPLPAQVVRLEGELLKGSGTVAKIASLVDVRILSDLPAGEKGTLWSSWGDGCVAKNGRYYFAVGNHLDLAKGAGQSRIYEFDPKTKNVKLVVNVRDVIEDTKIAAGKIHGRIDQGADGWLYFATYWGKVPDQADFSAGFKGSALLRYEPESGKRELLGVPVEGQGLPTSILDSQQMLFYSYAVYSGDFVVYDLAKREVKFRAGGDDQEGNRNIMLDRDGNAYFSTKGGGIGRYSREKNQIEATKAKLPGGSLRASTDAARSGVIFGMTQAGEMFWFDPKTEVVEDLGANLGREYTAVMVLSPDEKFVYYAPGAHGSGVRLGTPIVQYDIAAKRHKVIAFLNPAMRQQFKYNIGGTYNIKLSADGATLFCTFNGAPLEAGAKKEAAFGRPCLVVVQIPREER